MMEEAFDRAEAKRPERREAAREIPELPFPFQRRTMGERSRHIVLMASVVLP